LKILLNLLIFANALLEKLWIFRRAKLTPQQQTNLRLC